MEETFGHYRLLERLGRGGMAEVFKAKSFGVEGFEKVLVIKRILPELAASAEFVERFVREAKLAVRLSHANVVQVFDLGRIDDPLGPKFFMAMEYVGGLDLATLLARLRRTGVALPIGMCAYLASEVAKGLDHAHRRRDERLRPLGIVHADVSPENVLLSWEGEVKLSNFGIGRARSSLDDGDEGADATLPSKHAYMSPEQASGGLLSSQSDIFSLGVVLYEALAGVNPFSAPTVAETRTRVRAAEHPSLEAVRPEVPKGLATLVDKALALSPDDRFPDAGRMHEELLAFLYASGGRFGPNELSELLARFRDPEPCAMPELEPRSASIDSHAPPPAPTEPPPRRPGLSDAPPDALGKFVGRKEELRRLGELLALATRRRVQVVTIRGDQGAGKTRLLTEIDRRLRRGGFDVAFYLATCAPSGRGYPLSGLTAMLRVLCGVEEGDPKERIEQVEPRLRALALRDEEVSAVLSQLGADRGGGSAAGLRSGFARMVTSLCEDQLHVFAWDDAEALDEESLDLLDGALQRMAGVRAAFLLAGRTGFSHPLERLSGHAEVLLGPLGERDVERLIASRAGLRVVPESLAAFCGERACGHPQLVEEVVRELLDTGALVVENGGVVHQRLDGDVPPARPLRARLEQRLQGLPPATRAALDAAAILDDPANVTLLAAMLGSSAPHLDGVLAELAEGRLVRRHGTSSISFVSSLLREATLDALLPAARRELHAAAGAAYESGPDPLGAEHPERVARHFEEAGEHDRAATHCVRSGERRVAARQYAAAARDLSHALELCDPDRRTAAELARWIERLADVVHHVRSSHELSGVVGRLLPRIDEDGDLPTRVGARLDLARALGSTHAFDDADEHLEAARALAEGDEALTRRVLTVEAELAMRRGDFRVALARFDEASRSGAAADPREQTRTLLLLAEASAATGDRRRALDAVDRAEALAPPGDLVAACSRAKERALIHYFTREFEQGVRESERAVELGRAAGLRYEVAVNLHNLGDALIRLGDLPRAYAMLQQSCAMCDELGQERMAAQNRGYLAYLDALHGKAFAEKGLKDAVGYACVHGYSWDEVNGRCLLARLHEGAGDLEAARSELERTLELARGIGYRLIVDECEASLARLEPS